MLDQEMMNMTHFRSLINKESKNALSYVLNINSGSIYVTGVFCSAACWRKLMNNRYLQYLFTQWGLVTHICVSKLTIIGSDNGLSPDRRQAIIWTSAGLLSIGPLRTYFSENLIKIQQFSLKKMHVKMASAEWRPSCLGLNVLSIGMWCMMVW